MFVPTFISYFTGYLTITVSGNFCERFIQVCATSGILLWDIKRISKNSIRCKISNRAFLKLRKIAFNTGVKVHINIKHGFPVLIQKYKARKIVLFGIVIFICVVVLANQFVWGIEVRGNLNVPTERIISVLNESGLKIGMLKSKINQRELKKDSLLAIPELAWLWVNKKGANVIIDVREKIETPEVLGPNEYYNIVAKKDALIKTMTVKEGVPVVSEGETVLKNTVLVTGKIPVPSKQMTRYVKASATVMARVWYEKKEIYSLASTIRHETGRKKTHYTLNFFNNKIRIFHKDNPPYENYDAEEKKYELSGISLSEKTYTEISLEKELMTKESVTNFAVKELVRQIEEEVAPNSYKINSEVNSTLINDTTIEVTVKAEYLEDIAKPVKSEITEEETKQDLN